jgi:hypothetical protein
MADGAVLLKRHRKPEIGVQDAMFLDAGALTDADRFVVAPNNGAEPDANVFAQLNASDDRGRGSNPVPPWTGGDDPMAVKLV